MGRRKSKSAGGLVALCILCVASLALFTIYVKEGDCTENGCGPLHTVQLGAAEVLRPVRAIFSVVAGPFEDTLAAVGDAFRRGDEKQLRRDALENQEFAAEASRLRQENERLRELLDGQRLPYEYAPLARVTAPVGDQFTNRVIINVGSADGVQPEKPVIVGNNTLIGRTTDVSRHTAEVMLVTDQMFAAGVRIVPPAELDRSTGEVSPESGDAASYGEGMLSTGWEEYLGVEYVDMSAEVKKGDFVVTSGRSGDYELLFPPGLLVGTVESVSSEDYDQFKKIVVTPPTEPQDLQEVRVITGW
ncbi:MAG: rod shape-determining protein MreC [Actinomycetota bacterium]|nr:rod shape-determining protein MreC [Actinomycetota bacterium]